MSPSAGLKTCGLLRTLRTWTLLLKRTCTGLLTCGQSTEATGWKLPSALTSLPDCLSECPSPHHRHHPSEKWICCNQWTYTNTPLSSKVHSLDSILILYIMWVWMAIHMGTFSIIEWSISAFPMLLIKHIKHVLYTWHYSKSLRYTLIWKKKPSDSREDRQCFKYIKEVDYIVC